MAGNQETLSDAQAQDQMMEQGKHQISLTMSKTVQVSYHKKVKDTVS